MEDFFAGNNFDIVDKKTFAPKEITFDNIWGVCDEDMYNKAIVIINKEGQSGKPFFNHIMTVGNHRPSKYPNGKIDIPSDVKLSDGGVKHTDYAMRKFIQNTKKQVWYNNTMFVILADHFASSARKIELPLITVIYYRVS